MLTKPDDRTKAALRRLSTDSDFHEIMSWLEHSLLELDHVTRVQMDSVRLRQQQGGAQAIAEILEHARGKSKAIAIQQAEVNTRRAG